MSALLLVAVTTFVTASLVLSLAARRLERRHPMLFGRVDIGGTTTPPRN